MTKLCKTKIINTISKEFDMEHRTVIVNKNRLGLSYQQLYDEYKQRIKIIEKTQDLCVEIEVKDIKTVFKNKYSAAYSFLRSLYSSRDSMPDVKYIDKCKRVIEYLDKEGNKCLTN